MIVEVELSALNDFISQYLGGFYIKLDEITYVNVKVWPPSMKDLGNLSRAFISIPSIDSHF